MRLKSFLFLALIALGAWFVALPVGNVAVANTNSNNAAFLATANPQPCVETAIAVTTRAHPFVINPQRTETLGAPPSATAIATHTLRLQSFGYALLRGGQPLKFPILLTSIPIAVGSSNINSMHSNLSITIQT